MKRHILHILLLLASCSLGVQAKVTAVDRENGFLVRAGYTIGAVTPMPVPQEIIGINSFSPNGGISVGVEGYRNITDRISLSTGLSVFYKGFYTSANVKNYRMSITMEGNTMSGYFTGCDVTDITLKGLSVPVLVSVNATPDFRIGLGPYVEMYMNPAFRGEVYDSPNGKGYLRVDTPVGEKVIINRNNPASYDFSEYMRSFSGGICLSIDYSIMDHANVFVKADWSLTSALDPGFKAIAFRMYPIFATFGIAYRY